MSTRRLLVILSPVVGALALLWLAGSAVARDSQAAHDDLGHSRVEIDARGGIAESVTAVTHAAADPLREEEGRAIPGFSGVLSVTKWAWPDPVQAGARLTYTIRVTNGGEADLTAKIGDVLPVHINGGRTAGGTALVPGGRITWTARITSPGGVWTQTFAVTVETGYAGPLTNVVQVTAGGVTGAYTATCTSIVLQPLYLPLVLRNGPRPTRISGEYLQVGTPCTTDPCLPGLVYAVLVDDTYHFLNVDGAWLWWNRSWDGYRPEIGDFVTVVGYAEETSDVYGAALHKIEVVSLAPAPPPPPARWEIAIAEVRAFGSGADQPDEYVEIRNADSQAVQLNGWTLRNARHQVFTFPDYLMQPGQVCRVYTNEKHAEWCGFNWGSASEVWEYANDCAYLRDGLGTLVDDFCYCQYHTARMTIAASATTLRVGEAVTVTTTLFNYGCVGLGLPQYRLYADTGEPHPVLDPERPEPVVHYLGIGAGGSDAEQFVLEAVGPGRAVLWATTSFEVHLGYPGPAYWGASGSGPITITVEAP
jgi:hypothetical protein